MKRVVTLFAVGVLASSAALGQAGPPIAKVNATVVNSASNPVPVTMAPQEPFQVGTVPTSIGPNGIGTYPLVTVPAGKRLIVEGVSAWLNMSSQAGVASAYVSTTTQSANELVCVKTGASVNGLNHYFQCSSLVKLYAEAGQTLTFTVHSAEGGVAFRVFASGQFLPAP